MGCICGKESDTEKKVEFSDITDPRAKAKGPPPPPNYANASVYTNKYETTITDTPGPAVDESVQIVQQAVAADLSSKLQDIEKPRPRSNIVETNLAHYTFPRVQPEPSAQEVAVKPPPAAPTPTNDAPAPAARSASASSDQVEVEVAVKEDPAPEAREKAATPPPRFAPDIDDEEGQRRLREELRAEVAKAKSGFGGIELEQIDEEEAPKGDEFHEIEEMQTVEDTAESPQIEQAPAPIVDVAATCFPSSEWYAQNQLVSCPTTWWETKADIHIEFKATDASEVKCEYNAGTNVLRVRFMSGSLSHGVDLALKEQGQEPQFECTETCVRLQFKKAPKTGGSTFWGGLLKGDRKKIQEELQWLSVVEPDDSDEDTE